MNGRGWERSIWTRCWRGVVGCWIAEGRIWLELGWRGREKIRGTRWMARVRIVGVGVEVQVGATKSRKRMGARRRRKLGRVTRRKRRKRKTTVSPASSLFLRRD